MRIREDRKKHGRRRTQRRSRSGFTLIELLVVAVVLGIMAAAIVPRVIGRAEVVRRKRAEADIASLETQLDMFYLDMGRYPTTEEGLRVLYYEPQEEADKWNGPYMKKPQFDDPWGNAYVYREPGVQSDQPYEILSYGKDGQEGGENETADVVSWIDEEPQ